MLRYKHFQTGWLLIILFAGMLAYSAYFTISVEFNIVLIVLFVVFAILLLLFYNLSVEINETSLKIRFGVGAIRKSFLLKDIESCKIVKNPWYYGWGIR